MGVNPETVTWKDRFSKKTAANILESKSLWLSGSDWTLCPWGKINEVRADWARSGSGPFATEPGFGDDLMGSQADKTEAFTTGPGQKGTVWVENTDLPG